MADVVMTDAPAKAKAAPSTDLGDKKRFEVKKASHSTVSYAMMSQLT